MNKIHKFKDKPILIGGRAMEFYGLRKSHDYDFIISKRDGQALLKKYEPFDFPPVTPGFKFEKSKNKEFDFFTSMYHFDYDFFRKNAIKHKNFYVISKPDLIFLKSMTAYDPEAGPKRVITKSLKDIQLLVKSLI